MKLTRHNVVNVLIVLAFALPLAGFVFLSTRADDNPSELALVDQVTSTTERDTTTTTRPTTTSGLSETPTTAIPPTTTTTARSTATTARRATTTTASPTTTVAGPRGRMAERSDNSASFTHGQDGSFSASSTDPPPGNDPFRFVLRTAQGSGGVSGDTASVKVIAALTNHTSRAINFPGGLKVVVTMRGPSGSDLVFNMSAPEVINITPGETITLTSEPDVSGYGRFEATATCDVDYG